MPSESHEEFIVAEEKLGKELAKEYAGFWVAVENHCVVDYDLSLKPLVDRLKERNLPFA